MDLGGVVNSLPQTLFILMMVVGWGLLVVVLAAQTVLAVILVQQGRKLQSAAALHQAVAALRRDHAGLDETVSAWMMRNATRLKREVKKQRQQEEVQQEDDGESMIPGLVFPSLEGKQ